MSIPSRHQTNNSRHPSLSVKPGSTRAIILFLLAAPLLLLVSGFYTVETGNVAVEKTLGRVELQEVGEGLHWRLPLLTEVTEYSAKTITVDLLGMQPKASDNLTLEELDISVFYRVAPSQIAEMMVKYAASAEPDGDVWLPLHALMYREARSVAYDTTSQIPSLEMHRERSKLAGVIEQELRERFDEKDAGVLMIERVVVRDLKTDRSIEQSIQLAVQNQKKLEAKQVEVEIAEKDAEIEIKRAQGLAEANSIINKSLTTEYLQHEVNRALMLYGENGCPTTIIPANMQGAQLLLDASGGGAGKSR